jgi:hypothetical protein
MVSTAESHVLVWAVFLRFLREKGHLNLLEYLLYWLPNPAGRPVRYQTATIDRFTVPVFITRSKKDPFSSILSKKPLMHDDDVVCYVTIIIDIAVSSPSFNRENIVFQVQ